MLHSAAAGKDDSCFAALALRRLYCPPGMGASADAEAFFLQRGEVGTEKSDGQASWRASASLAVFWSRQQVMKWPNGKGNHSTANRPGRHEAFREFKELDDSPCFYLKVQACSGWRIGRYEDGISPSALHGWRAMDQRADGNGRSGCGKGHRSAASRI